MKILISFFILTFAFTAFGQTRKHVVRKTASAAYPMRLVVKPVAKVSVTRTDGGKISGLFVSGDTEKIIVELDGINSSIKLADIRSLNFGDGSPIDTGSVNFSSENSLDRANVAPAQRVGDYEKSYGSPVQAANGQGIGSANDQSTIRGGILNGNAVSLVKPSYPPAARAVHATGVVNVQVLIDEAGNIISAVAVSGHPLLRTAAVNAALESKFSPTMLGSDPVKVSGIITYNFVP